MSLPKECDPNMTGLPACVVRLNHRKFYANECLLCRDMGVGVEYTVLADVTTSQNCS